MNTAELITFLDRMGDVIHVEITRVRGSSPREKGAAMFVSAQDMIGTIGGGQLEYMALDMARSTLKSKEKINFMDVPLGPEIGQCCGGRVEITLTRMTAALRAAALSAQAQTDADLPHVYVFGAGHVGRALADLFQHMPVRCLLVDSRSEELAQSAAQVEKCLTALPETEVRAAPDHSVFIVLTHDHALDFLIVSEALASKTSCWVGMIGSATKRSTYERYARTECDGLNTHSLICPIGASGSRDKRPSVIAAAVVAEVMTALTSETAAQPSENAHT